MLLYLFFIIAIVLNIQLIISYLLAPVQKHSLQRSSITNGLSNNYRNMYIKIDSRKNYLIQMSSSNPPIRSAEWARLRGFEPGYGGYWPGDPNAKKYKVTIKSKKTGEEFTAMVPNDRYIYMYFEELGIELPVINKAKMCRQGCCTICTLKLEKGSKVKMDAPLGLLKDFREDGYALSCCSKPRSDIVCEIQDEDEMYIRQWADGFEGGGKEWGGVFMDED